MARMTISDVARHVGVHKSTVSRQARSFGLVGADGLVDLESYQQVRAGGLDPALQTTGPAARRVSTDATETTGLAAERLRKVTAEANRVEMENAVKRGEMVPRASIEAVIGPAARQLRERVQELARDTITDDAERAQLIDGIDDTFEQFALEALNGGAPPG